MEGFPVKIEKTTSQEVRTSDLLEKLREGWTPAHSGWVQELVLRWAALLNADLESEQVEENSFQFVARMNNLRLRGMDDVPCLVMTDAQDLTQLARDFWRQASLRGLPFVFALTPAAEAAVAEVFPADRRLLLTRGDIAALLNSGEPQSHFKQILWQQVPRRRLDPYNLLVPAEGGMFFGRYHEMERLQHEDNTSFAIAGPGRIGKTSLLKRYKEVMTRNRDPRTHCRFMISFYDCSPAPNAVSRFVAMRIDSSKRSNNMTDAKFMNFLRYLSRSMGSPLDLLLDEVDLVCESEAFRVLGAAAREGFCRLVLCGRGVLLKASLSEASLLSSRLDLMKLEPLDKKAARDLILLPLRDLGFAISDLDEFLGRVLRLTGRLPYLLQFYGQKLAQIAIEENTDVISPEHIDTLQGDFVTAQYFIKPLNDLEDAEARLIGLSLLKECKLEFSIPFVLEVAAQAGITLTHKRAIEICNSLVISNVLAWQGSAYRIANEGLYIYARDMGYLDNALEESTRGIKERA
jgi:hypothetical protein